MSIVEMEKVQEAIFSNRRPNKTVFDHSINQR